MRRFQVIVLIATFAPLVACGASQPVDSTSDSTDSAGGLDPATRSSDPDSSGSEADEGTTTSSGDSPEFQETDAETAAQARGGRAAPPSELRPTATEAALRLFVVDGQTTAIDGIVIKLRGPDGREYYTRETDAEGHSEVLVPIGQRYELEYLSLGRQNTTAAVDVPARPNQTLRLTLRYRGERPRQRQGGPEGFILEGVLFDTARATIQAESHPRLDRVVEYLTHRPNVRILIAGHTDNVGNARANQRLSERRAQAVREYLVTRGIDGARIEAIGFGDEHPVAPNDTAEGRSQNRRIEAMEL